MAGVPQFMDLGTRLANTLCEAVESSSGDRGDCVIRQLPIIQDALRMVDSRLFHQRKGKVGVRLSIMAYSSKVPCITPLRFHDHFLKTFGVILVITTLTALSKTSSHRKQWRLGT